MKSLFPIALLCFFLVVACGKDKLETKPRISIKSVNTRVVPISQNLVVDLEFRDKEGDASDSIFIIKQRLNVAPVQGSILRPLIGRDIPDFPKRQMGEIRLDLEYNDFLVSAETPNRNPLTQEIEPDSLNFKFVVKDKAGHFSDTVVLERIIILRK
jgi:hypothetical protein